MIYTVTLNPALDKTVQIPSFALDQVNRITTMRTDPGGKGINVSKVIRCLGGSSIAAGILAGETGRQILDSLQAMGLNTRFLFVPGQTRTNLKIIDPVLHTNTDLNEPGPRIPQDILDQLLNDLCSLLVPGDLAVLSGSLPPGCPEDLYETWTAAFQAQGAKVILDADQRLLKAGLKAAPYMIKPNHHELSALAGCPLKTPQELEHTARSLMEQYRIPKAVVSMGAQGALYLTETQTLFVHGLKVPVGSTVGAGDSMVAALALAEEAGMSLEEAARLSSAAAAANVMCSGTQPAAYETVASLIPQVVLEPFSEFIQRKGDCHEALD